MRQSPVQYHESRPRYLAWGVRLQQDPADVSVATNFRVDEFFRTYGREPLLVAKEVLRSLAQNRALQYWDANYPDDIAIDVHRGEGKPTEFKNWHLISELVVEAHTQNALQAYLERYKRCLERDGPDAGQGVKRPHEGALDDDEPPAKKVKCVENESLPVVQIKVTARTQNLGTDQVDASPTNQQLGEPSTLQNQQALLSQISQLHSSSFQSNEANLLQPQELDPSAKTSFQSHDSNQENRPPAPSSYQAQPTQPPELPSTSFQSDISSNPADLPPTPPSSQPSPSFQVYVSSSAIQSSRESYSAEAQQPEEVVPTEEEPVRAEQSQHILRSSIEESQGETLLLFQPDSQQEDSLQLSQILAENLHQRDLHQHNVEQRNQVLENLQRRNPLMRLLPQDVPLPQIPPAVTSNSVDQQRQSPALPAQPPVQSLGQSSNYSGSPESLLLFPTYASQFHASPDQMTNVSSNVNSDATKDDPNLPPKSSSNSGTKRSSSDKTKSASPNPDAPMPRTNDCKSAPLPPHPASSLSNQLTARRGLLRHGTCLPRLPPHQPLLRRNLLPDHPPQRPPLPPPRRNPQPQNRSPRAPQNARR